MRTRVKGRCQLKLTTLGAAKVCFLKENGIARVCEAHFCSIYILSHRPEAPQGSVSPVAVTGRPISWESTRPENFFSSVEIR